MNHQLDAKLVLESAKERVEPIRQQREQQRQLQQQADSWLLRLQAWLRTAVAGQTRKSAQLQPVKITSREEDPCPAC
ncbi:MAG: hypothetical protein CL608_17680 [Anaerolineaceae bacterium]|nr:hypothetical protein [Anaerolineaceae bacterium]